MIVNFIRIRKFQSAFALEYLNEASSVVERVEEFSLLPDRLNKTRIQKQILSFAMLLALSLFVDTDSPSRAHA